jgi:16S rRNA (cytosine967-C5)-methyltransferase
MKLSGRLAAAIEILEDFHKRPAPLKTVLAEWARGARYAGAKDRAWISGLCLDVLRRRNSLAAAMDDDGPRALALGALRFLWGISSDALAEIAAEEPHGPGALTEGELQHLAASHPFFPAKAGIQGAGILDPGFRREERDVELLPHMNGDFPEWMMPHITRVFGENAAHVMAGLAERADIDLRINTLKAAPEKALAALMTVNAEALPILTNAARISAPDAAQRAPSVTIIPAFNKGWLEVQDLGSQIAAAAAGAVKGAQVLDYCAGGGGKSLALAALMENTGQLYAYDGDPMRLKPIYERARRAGVRNLQIINPATNRGALESLKDKMDVVFVDAPCTGCGVWRRHPDAKWRLTPQQLERRMAEQGIALAEAAQYVKPGGRLVWATCSFLMEENEDRLAAFLRARPNFSKAPALDAVAASGILTDAGRAALEACLTSDGALRLTPDKLRADGFFIAVLERR